MSCCDDDCHVATADPGYRRILWAALGINASTDIIDIMKAAGIDSPDISVLSPSPGASTVASF